MVASSQSRTKKLQDVNPEKPGLNEKVYYSAYVDKPTGALVKSNKALTLNEAKIKLYSSNGGPYTQMLKPRNQRDIKGIYTFKQKHAKQLAIEASFSKVVFKLPEVHSPGYYGHYHDADHNYHIWFGSPINY